MNARTETNPSGPGWSLTWSPLRRGAGYRAYDFPWHRMSIHAPRWRTAAWVSHIPGLTLRVIWNARVTDRNTLTSTRRRLVVQFGTNGNRRDFACPAWW